MSIAVQGVSYIHPDKEVLFHDINFVINKGQKVALIGNNGSGKSTLLQILAGKLEPSEGSINCSSLPYYVPQHFGQYNGMTVAEALGTSLKLKALHSILAGDASEANFAALDDDWDIEERCITALSFWELEHVRLDQSLDTLSGGEKTKVFLSGIKINCPSIVLMDEPTNHLDINSRERLYGFIENTATTLLVVSHDITLLNKLPYIYELAKNEVVAYGGNYGFYKEQKNLQLEAMHSSLDEKEKQLRQARKTAREAAERKQREDARGKKRGEKQGIPKILMGNRKDKAEKSTAKLAGIHDEKMGNLKEDIKNLQNSLPDNSLMKLGFDDPALHTGKILAEAKEIDFRYNGKELWQKPLTFQIRSGDRLSIQGRNGSGKTTLMRIITGELQPQNGTITTASFSHLYIDQEYSIIDDSKTLPEQVETFNTSLLRDHEIKTLLNRFLFPHAVWGKKCQCLSGGEKMRLMLCCLHAANKAPDMLLLDEPTNNLDIQSAELLTSVIKDYKGTILVISHDSHFTNEIRIEKTIEL